MMAARQKDGPLGQPKEKTAEPEVQHIKLPGTKMSLFELQGVILSTR